MENRKTVVENIVDYLDANQGEEVSIEDLAVTFHFNRHYLMKMFKKTVGLTITQYRNFQKINASIQDLVNTDDKILKIALKHGFHSLEYYSETFYKMVGVSPLQFRKSGYLIPQVEEENMEKTRLQQIEEDLKFLHNLRNQIVGEPMKQVEETIRKEDRPKQKLLIHPDSKKAA